MKKNKLLILVTIIISINLIIIGCSKKEDSSEGEVGNYIPVEVLELNRENLKNSRSFSGKVVPNEEIFVMPKIMGTVNSVNVKLGDKVSKGQVLFTIEQDDINKNIEQSQVNINLAEKGVQQALNAIETSKINKITSEENLSKSKLDLDRSKTLFEEGAIPKSQLEQAELAYSSAESQAKLVDAQIQQAEIGLEQAKAQLEQANISYRQVSDNLDNTVIKSPIDGIVSSLDVKVGQIVTNSQPAATIIDSKKVSLEIEVVEDIVNKLKLGQPVEVSIPSALSKPLASKIDYISPTADIASKLYSVKAYIDNPENLIKPGMSGDLILNLEELLNVIALNRDTILEKDGESFVFIVEDNKAIKKIVKTGSSLGDYVEILDGLTLGDQIIVKGHHYVSDNRDVKIVGGED